MKRENNGGHFQDEVANDGESVLLALPLSLSLTLMFEQCCGGPWVRDGGWPTRR